MRESPNDLLNKPYISVGSMPCWSFCQRILGILGGPVPRRLSEMQRVEQPKIGVVVLFRQRKGFHAGVVWPDTLHFIHARAPLNQPNHPPIGRLDRLNDPLYEPIIDGYYVYEGDR